MNAPLQKLTRPLALLLCLLTLAPAFAAATTATLTPAASTVQVGVPLEAS